jgi:5-methylthioadenosine/S-adenosylhomocysteine deaminase
MFRHGVRVGFGSDGFGAAMLDEAYVGILAWRLNERLPSAGWTETELMLLRHNPVIASSILDEKIGEIAEGSLADVVIAAYDAPTPVGRENLWTHLLSRELKVDTVLVGGRVVVDEGRSCLVDEASVLGRAREVASGLWGRM